MLVLKAYRTRDCFLWEGVSAARDTSVATRIL